MLNMINNPVTKKNIPKINNKGIFEFSFVAT